MAVKVLQESKACKLPAHSVQELLGSTVLVAVLQAGTSFGATWSSRPESKGRRHCKQPSAASFVVAQACTESAGGLFTRAAADLDAGRGDP